MPPVAEQQVPGKSLTWILWVLIGLIAVVFATFGAMYYQSHERTAKTPVPVVADEQPTSEAPFTGTATVPYEKSDITLSPDIALPFDLSEVKNIPDIEEAFGVDFTPSDMEQLEKNKFVVKNLLDTQLTPVSVGENSREFPSLYGKIAGESDYKLRTPANALFVSADVLTHLYSVLSVELLRETENAYLFPQVYATTKKLYEDASMQLRGARNDTERVQYMKVRNYFAVPYALLSTMQAPLDATAYWNSDRQVSLEDMQKSYLEKDVTVDTKENVISFVKSLKLDTASEKAVIADITLIYAKPDKAVPNIFKDEYSRIPGGIQFTVPFSLFTVRGTYTSTSLRRQYFRAVQWYQQIPFFTSSPELTTYALRIGELMHKNPELLADYNALTGLLAQLVGDSDDLDVADYEKAVTALGDSAYVSGTLNPFLDTQKPPARIKALPATYDSVGVVTRDEVINATRGMRFFSQKFIPDSYWTGKLTQGDEVGDVQGMKLPHSASSLEVMTILGSTFAQAQLPLLPFYNDHKQAIDTRLKELRDESASWGESYWGHNQVTGIMWAISGMFAWDQKNQALLPAFMQSQLWGAKTLLTASGFWTELRHTNILYAKQSFAEKGGGGGDDECDVRPIPAPVYGYIEPQPEAYDRLYYSARMLEATYADRGSKLKNFPKLHEYTELLSIVREYTQLQLANTAFKEPTMRKHVALEKNTNCEQQFIDPSASVVRGSTEYAYTADKKWVAALSRAEELRIGITRRMQDLLPLPVEGPILPIKDKRAAVVADIHTSEDGIVEEGTGVPRVIFVAVKDANGARLTTGFTYSHYEFLSDKRLTDEEWQGQLYTNEGGDYSVTYKPKTVWPELPSWYVGLLGTR